MMRLPTRREWRWVIAGVSAWAAIGLFVGLLSDRDTSETRVGREPVVVVGSNRGTVTPGVAAPSAKPSAQPTDLPRLDHQGDGPLNCAIRYATEESGHAGWTTFASHPGVLDMRATTLDGHIYTKEWAVTTSQGRTVTVTTMSVPVPLTKLRAVSGTLTDVDTAQSYTCLVGPEAL